MMDAKPIFLISATADGVTAPAQATVDSTRAQFVMPGTDSFVTWACAALARITAVLIRTITIFISLLSYSVGKRVTAFLRAADCDDSRRNHARITYDVCDQLFVNFLCRTPGGCGDCSRQIARCHAAYRQLSTAFGNAVDCDPQAGEHRR